MINQIVLFLQGKTKEVENVIKDEIEKCINSLDFEKAASLKQRLEDIKTISEKQNVANLNEESTDIFGYIYSKDTLHIQVFKIRNYKMVLNDNIELQQVIVEELDEVISQIISQYYSNMDSKDIPKKIFVKMNDEVSSETISKFLTDKRQSKVEVITPKKGEKLKLIGMVENNIKINIEESNNNVIEDLKDMLNIQDDINSIECYDISNLRNDYIVGCMIRFEDGKLNKKMYRKFKIKSTLEQNDPMCIYEVLSRRLKHSDEWILPDIILIDGGKTQLSAAKKALDEKNESTYIYGMIKNDKHRTRGLIDTSGNEYDLSNKNEFKKILNFLTFLQDEIHRFTISYHRSLRDKIKK
jgi:excinuclease ABC subunit C